MCFEMGPPLRREEGSDYYWSLPLYWGVTRAATHSLTDCPLPPLHTHNTNSTLIRFLAPNSHSPKSKSKSCYDRRSVGQLVLVSSPIWGPRPDFFTVTRPPCCRYGASSLRRGRVCYLPRSHLYLLLYISPFYTVSCQKSGSLWTPTVYIFTCTSSTYVCMYVECIQGLCQSRLGTEDRALTHVASVTTATWSLERSYA
jgi:hypothetical protein